MKRRFIQFSSLKIKLLDDGRVFMPSKRSLFLAKELPSLNLKNKKIIDVGVGSGFLSIACGFLGADQILGLDISKAALSLTEKNWGLNRLKAKLILKNSHVFDGLKCARWQNQFDLIISNPPMLPTGVVDEIKSLKFSPWMWNASGPEGRLFTDKLLREAPFFLKKGSFLLFTHSSRLGVKKTNKLLEKKFSSWSVLKKKDFTLEKRFKPFINFWLKKQDEQKIFKRKGKFWEKIEIIKAVK
jgi:release factor glutamine methyltransferase